MMTIVTMTAEAEDITKNKSTVITGITGEMIAERG
jgi:hypothetical protein